jgi:hypothetical protein
MGKTVTDCAEAEASGRLDIADSPAHVDRRAPHVATSVTTPKQIHLLIALLPIRRVPE